MCALLALPAAPAAARDKELLQLFITQPYLELHSGPGRGYPVTQVVGRGDSVDVIMRRTEWFKVRTERGIEGWASEQDLVLAQLADGSAFTFNRGDRAGFISHRWETGVMAGDYAGASMISAYQSFSFNDQLKIELTAGQYLGNISNGYVVEIGINHVFMPQWRLSPFVTLGTGLDHVAPKVTLAEPLDSTDQTAYVGLGVRYYWARRFFVRGEYRHHTVFTSRDQNEVKQEWKLGLAFFY
ncbi:MAG: SH3 domain-containing protein [Steroidobacteraceae bacterium]